MPWLNVTMDHADFAPLASPCLPTAPPAYFPPVEAIGDEPSSWSEKTAPPPYAAADPEPSATALLRAERAVSSQGRCAFDHRMSTLSTLSSLSQRDSPLNGRPLTSTPRDRPHTFWQDVTDTDTDTDTDSDSGSDGSELSDLSEDSDVPYVRVAEPDDADRESAFSQRSTHPDRTARLVTADPKWCGREAIWWHATQRARHHHHRSASVNNGHEERQRFDSCNWP